MAFTEPNYIFCLFEFFFRKEISPSTKPKSHVFRLFLSRDLFVAATLMLAIHLWGGGEFKSEKKKIIRILFVKRLF